MGSYTDAHRGNAYYGHIVRDGHRDVSEIPHLFFADTIQSLIRQTVIQRSVFSGQSFGCLVVVDVYCLNNKMTKRPKGFTFRFSLFTPFIFPLHRSRYLRSENPTLDL